MKDSSTATERVGRYQLLEPIGGGPNGMVSRAKVFGVAGFERQFAVKRFLPELTVGSVAQALSAAARSYGGLEHPRIARMSEFGVAQGQTFTAVEYVAGLDAARLLQESKLAGIAIAAGGALALVSQAARAVGYAHGRGLSHLGLSPTNVIVTADGDVKVTDFGILAATMPGKPVEVARLAPRIPYLAPEQLAGEATSAATDVFVLGVIAYELVTGQRAYRGDTPAQIAQAIQAGPPAEPPLPRPIVRVLQRCLARSPFERFPDARALADALDAALRVAPVPGTRKDIGAQIKTTLERYASLNEGNMSGMVALNLQTAPLANDPVDYARSEARTEPSAVPIVNEATLRDAPKYTTVPGIAPPPTRVPPAGPAKTMIGLPPVTPKKLPSIVPPAGKKPNGPPPTLGGPPPPPPPASVAPPPPPASVAPPPPAPSSGPPPPPPRRNTPPPMPAVRPEVIDEPSGLIEVEDSRPITASDEPTVPGHAPENPLPPPIDDAPFETRTGEMSQMQVEELSRRSVKSTSELPTTPKPVDATDRAVAGELVRPAPTAASPPVDQPTPIAHEQTVRVRPPAPAAARSSGKGLAIAIGLVVLAGLGVGGWYAYSTLAKKKEPEKVAKVDNGSAKKPVANPPVDAAPRPIDAALAVVAVDAEAKVAIDAAVKVAAVVDAGDKPTGDKPTGDKPTGDKPTGDKPGTKPSGDKPGTKPTTASDQLQINSKPAGARVFIDGADQGTTPVKLPGSSDRHTMVVLSPGHELHISEVDGHGVFDISLKAVTPSGGHAGIKVIKCKAKERYYVYVDGNPTGMTCPTERIDTVVGPHTVEVYDIVTDSRRKWDINVKDERLSARVRIDD